MSNVASLELCKELYELTGWEDSNFYFEQRYVGDELWAEPLVYGEFPGKEKSGEPYGDVRRFFTPAYHCGYLLRRLPKTKFGNGSEIHGTVTWSNKWDKWITQWSRAYVSRESGDQVKLYTYKADTPEDALAKLCIGLSKQGAIK